MRRLLGLLAAASAVAGALLVFVAGPGGFGASADRASAATTAQQIGMKVLLITDATSEPGYTDWVATLQREGVPYDTVITNPTGSTAAGTVLLPTLSTTAGDGTQVANYEGVIVAGSGTQNMSDTQWATLQTFEHQFSVRQISAYVYPSSDYGLTTPAGGATFPTTTALSLTTDGKSVFPYLNAVALDPTASTYGYEATPLVGASVDTLIGGPNSSSLVGIYTSSDGRQTMYQTFDQSQYYLQSQLLRHGELNWLTRDTYFGFQRNYLETDVDDNFLSDDTWCDTTAGCDSGATADHSTDYNPADALREVPSDVTTAAAWSKANNFRIDMLFNGGGSVNFSEDCAEAVGGDGGSGGTTGGTGCNTTSPSDDPVLAQFQSTDSTTGKPYTDDFGWISHTWDHPNIDEGCATTNYIEAEFNQNTNWAAASGSSAGNPTTGGLGLTTSTDATDALGNDNPSVIVTGEHSGIANLLPGNPGQVDPPAFDAATGSATGGTLAAGQYVYAVADQFNTAAPGALTPAAAAPTAPNTTEESAGSISSPVTVTGATSSVALSWGAVCHAADYLVYRAPYTGTAPTGTTGTWTLIGDVPAAPTDFANPSSTTDTTNGGAVEKQLPDTGLAGITVPAGVSPTPLTEGTADESAYEQNPNLDTAFAATLDGGIKYFGADASKPYPNPANGSFATGSAPATQYASGATFSDAGATGIPRYPTNIYYNLDGNAQEVDEYQTLYDSAPSGECTPIANVTTCNPSGTAFTIAQIIASVDQGMFLHLMGNDPRPSYFHQTNMMNVNTGLTPDPAVPSANALFYQTVQPLLDEYSQYFNSTAPIEQPTMAEIGTLLSEQATWGTAAGSSVTGSIEGNQVAVDNAGTGAIEVPLTGTTGGTAYAGSQSYWTSVNPGTSTFTAVNTWPALPTTPPIVTVPTGPAPSTGGTKMPTAPQAPATPTSVGGRTIAVHYVAYQAAPKTVKLSKKGKVTVSLTCKATSGKTAKGKTCAGTFTLTVAGQKLSHSFKFKSGKVDRITLTLKSKVRTAVITAARRNARPHARHKKPAQVNGKLVITTKLSAKTHQTTKGTLTVKT